jgi:hypothetical protein
MSGGFNVPRAGNSNWSVQTDGLSVGGGATVYGAGGDPAAMQSSSRLDRLRMGAGQTPDAQYPDGYLGSVTNRYSGKKDPKAMLITRLGDRSYQRGIHKDTKMDASAYFWPSDFGPDSGLKNEARGKMTDDGTILVPRFSPPGDPAVKFSAGIANERDMMRLYSRYGINAHTGQGTDSVDPARASILTGMLPPMSW